MVVLIGTECSGGSSLKHSHIYWWFVAETSISSSEIPDQQTQELQEPLLFLMILPSFFGNIAIAVTPSYKLVYTTH